MQINKEIFLNLSEEKQQFIEGAFLEVKNGNLTVEQFVNNCAQRLTEYEYNNLFMSTSVSPQHYNQDTYDPSPEYIQPQQYGRHGGRMMVESPQLNTEQNNKKSSKNADDNIDDIIQYTGVNLKEEAENIVKELCYTYTDTVSTLNMQSGSGSLDWLFNLKLYSKFINNCCADRNVKITEEGVSVIFLFAYRKMVDFFEKVDEASKIRTEYDMSAFNIAIKNERSKQMWYLNELEKLKFEKLNMQNDKDKKKKTVQEREDLVIKKKQSNTVAMAAMGVKQKSWMGSAEKLDEKTKFDSLYAPLDEKRFLDKNRTITTEDIIYVLERDKRYNKSIFLLKLLLE